jgi:hypothetical protein
VNYSFATIGLTLVAFALLFLLAVTLKANQIRLFLLLPALTSAVFLITLRILHLRLRGRWAFLQAGLCAVIMAQITFASYYLPLSPISFGLFLLGPAYGLTILFSHVADGKSWKNAIPEPIGVHLIFWILALWLR